MYGAAWSPASSRAGKKTSRTWTATRVLRRDQLPRPPVERLQRRGDKGAIHNYLVEFGGTRPQHCPEASTTARLSITPQADLAVEVLAPVTAVTGAALSVDLTATERPVPMRLGWSSPLTSPTFPGHHDYPGLPHRRRDADVRADGTGRGGRFNATVTGTAPGTPKVITVEASITST